MRGSSLGADAPDRNHSGKSEPQNVSVSKSAEPVPRRCAAALNPLQKQLARGAQESVRAVIFAGLQLLAWRSDFLLK